MKHPEYPAWKQKLHEIIYEADTPAGKLFDIVLLFFIVFSVVLVMLESITSINTKYEDTFYIAEWVITIIFSIEYILRIIVIKRPRHYIFSFYGIVDLLSTLPSYISFFFGGQNLLLTIRALRLLRVFRILKVTRYIGESNKLASALRNSKAKILVFLFAVLIICVIAGTLMYLIEGENGGFDNIPLSIYWCIVTLTTVGFGDIAPITPLGRFIASLIMIMGYGIIAVPTGIVSAEYNRMGADGHHGNTQVCPNCNEDKHLDTAHYCHKCGHLLNA
ncbi:MAG: ion transporter [Bacteroidota bacterium]|uniref:Potassium voltage-gated channel subfamily KQT n=1 Tax=Christiangramia flava JLT2011 TaxID=1229726 RepID=A0A1L7I1X2_9FLAO|nr:ion transporter [Christiangramia flava]APU67135.1 Potassium voltage-gated channel subfamily KQT [Christiangramia flava JLT2011]MAM20137.1 ion transporter [Christiangramia sp.]MEE2770815.1 ion transporter [Bacteroidota bacterium]OSS38093.1 Potassium voltage-gated channel subfamily KQT [Christiangramia flava JLT2011]